MIVFDLRCALNHAFEGWFESAAAFDAQAGRGLVTCPICDNAQIARVPSARVAVPKERAPAAPVAAAQAPQPMAAGFPPELVAKLREVVRATEDVGARFPEEARKIHYEEVPHRPIRGVASADEAKALADEGIEFAPIPPILTRDEH
jgi:hypothetical protein